MTPALPALEVEAARQLELPAILGALCWATGRVGIGIPFATLVWFHRCTAGDDHRHPARACTCTSEADKTRCVRSSLIATRLHGNSEDAIPEQRATAAPGGPVSLSQQSLPRPAVSIPNYILLIFRSLIAYARVDSGAGRHLRPTVMRYTARRLPATAHCSVFIRFADHKLDEGPGQVTPPRHAPPRATFTFWRPRQGIATASPLDQGLFADESDVPLT